CVPKGSGFRRRCTVSVRAITRLTGGGAGPVAIRIFPTSTPPGNVGRRGDQTPRSLFSPSSAHSHHGARHWDAAGRIAKSSLGACRLRPQPDLGKPFEDRRRG